LNHPSKNSGFGRMVVIFGLLSGPGFAAHAQISDVTPPSEARSLGCLVRKEKPPSYPSKLEKHLGSGFLRVLLHFTRPDEAPRVEVLANTAAPEMQDEAFSYLASYRLPCLSAADGVVKAVQEFHFRNTDRDPLPMEAGTSESFCVVMPREPMEPPSPWPGERDPEHVVAVASFSGDGQQPPEVKLIHSTGSKRFEALVRERMALYRMPCRTGQESPRSMRQQFSYFPANGRRYVMKRDAFELREFLGMTADIHKVSAEFDFNTMACPFKVNYTPHGPSLPNEVTAQPEDPNRYAFLKWLAQRQLAFRSERQANDLFGSVLQIQVPCGTLNLQAKLAASREDAQ